MSRRRPRVAPCPSHVGPNLPPRYGCCFRVYGMGPWPPGYHITILTHGFHRILVCYLYTQAYPSYKTPTRVPSEDEAREVIRILDQIGRLAPAIATAGLRPPRRPKA